MLVLDAFLPDRRKQISRLGRRRRAAGRCGVPAAAGRPHAPHILRAAGGAGFPPRAPTSSTTSRSRSRPSCSLGAWSSYSSRSTRRDSRLPAGEYYFLLLMSVSGAVTLAASRDVLTLVVALEVVSLPAFALVALPRYDGRSSEAALKLFLVSVVSTAVMLFGLSLVYGVTGHGAPRPHRHGAREPGARNAALLLGVRSHRRVRVQGGGGAVPLLGPRHLRRRARAGRRLSVGGVQGRGLRRPRAAAHVGFAPYADVWAPAVAVLAAVTMTVGNLVALRQRQAVRLLAWSSIAQSGYMLVPLGAAGKGDIDGVLPATVAYVLAYAVMNLGAFAVVTLSGAGAPRTCSTTTAASVAPSR